jgi:hypothetical protein
MHSFLQKQTYENETALTESTAEVATNLTFKSRNYIIKPIRVLYFLHRYKKY